MEYNLNGIWKMREKTDSEWLDVTVPSSVMNDLLTHQKIDDPFYRDNEDQSIIIAEKDYEYVKKFVLTEEFLLQDKIILRAEGLDTLATIYINDTEIASTNNMHRTYEFDVKELLRIGRNEIEIILCSPVNYIKQKQEEQQLTGVDHAIEGYPHLRKAHSMFGWDWGPKIPDFGIWRDISIIGWNIGRIDNVYISQIHIENQVQLNVYTELEKLSDEYIELEVVVTNPAGSKEVKSVTASNLKGNVLLTIDNPQLWWPNGYGEQPLYEVKVIAKANDQEVDRKAYQIGLRTIEVKHEPDQWGKSFEFHVNGISLLDRKSVV